MTMRRPNRPCYAAFVAAMNQLRFAFLSAILTLSLFGVESALGQPSVSAATGDPFELFALAREVSATGELQEANALWLQGLELFPSEPYARLEYAEQLRRWRRIEEAAEQYQVASELAPENPDILWAAGLFFRRHTDSTANALDRSEALLSRLLEINPDDHRAWVELGVVYLSRRQYAPAADSFRQAREIAPFNLAASGYLAEALMRSENPGEAEEVLRDLLEKDPFQLRARIALTKMFSDRGEVFEAVELLRQAPVEQANDPGLSRRLAILLVEADQHEKARSLLSSLLATSPGDQELRRLAVRLESAVGRYDQAADLLRSYVATSPEDLPATLELAEYLQILGLHEEATEVLGRSRDALADGTEGRRRATLLRLDLLGRSGQWSTVVEETAPLVENPQGPDWTVFPLYAEALFHTKGLKASRRALNRLAEADSDVEPAVRAKEGELLLLAGEEDQARQVLAELAAREGVLGPSLVARVWSIRDRPEEAVEFAAEAVRRAPDRLETRYQWAVALDTADRWLEAERELLTILKQEPVHGPALNFLGYSWAEQGINLEQALELTLRAVETSPDNGAYLDSLGWAYFGLQRFQEARPYLEKAAALIPNDAVILEHLGDLYRAIGENEKARTFYQWAVKTGDGGDELTGKLGNLPEDG